MRHPIDPKIDCVFKALLGAQENCNLLVHRYRLRDDQGRSLLDHGDIWVLELNKFTAERVTNEAQPWLKFFKDGERLDEAALPDWMQTAEMRQAMIATPSSH